MSTPVELVLSKLPDARRNGKGWSARCPAHDDRRPSLSITEGDDGRALICCHADKGCTPEAIVAALGLKLADLMPDNGVDTDTNRESPRKRAIVSTAGRRAAQTFPSAREAVAELERRHGKRSGLWTYRDAPGDPVGVIVRWDTPKGKDIRPVARIGGQWIIGGMPEPRPLYCLPDLAGAKRVYVTEGEKAADAARSLGLTATTSPHGAKSADKSDWSPLAGKQVVILPDNDQPGKQYADAVVAILSKLTPAPVVKVVDLPDLPDHGDIADFIASHCEVDRDELRRQVEALADAAEGAEVVQPRPAILSWRPFPVDALPEPARSFVAGLSHAMGCDPAYAALPALSAIAGAIGNTRRLLVSNTWHAPASIWSATVGESGAVKSHPFREAVAPLRKRQGRFLRQHKTDVEDYQRGLLVYDKELANWRKSKDESNPPEKPEEPTAVRYIVTDTTVEALAPILLANPRGLLLASDELAGWIGSFDRYAGGKGGADAAHWLSMFDGESLTVDRKTGFPRTIYVPSALVSVTGTIQPAILHRALGAQHRDSGLAARLLMVCPPRLPKRWREEDIEPAMLKRYAAMLERLCDLQPETDDDGEPRPVLLSMTRGAKRLWRQFFNEHNEKQVDLVGEQAAAWSKLEGYAARLALVIHITRWAADDPKLAEAGTVDEASMEAAIVLVRWFRQEALRVYAMLAEGREERDRRRLVEWIERKGGRVTVRDLQQGRREIASAEAAEAAMNDLVGAGLGSWEPVPTTPHGGRPSRVFCLSGDVYVYETPEISEKDGGCVDVDNVDGAGSDPNTLLSDVEGEAEESDDWGAI